ncbi:MAG: hypothetical protein H6765_06280 [Candidatus Peribacteria bacterium]|nr:MAG: hypothetical protein H6765_06280 [Candidatus Peribacteria bacterium]
MLASPDAMRKYRSGDILPANSMGTPTTFDGLSVGEVFYGLHAGPMILDEGMRPVLLEKFYEWEARDGVIDTNLYAYSLYQAIE